MADLQYNDNVFINCPFDADYRNNLHAIVFTVYSCSFKPISALSEDNGADNRLLKIQNLIEKSRYGIHDISRTELNERGFPRFNMPFEAGIFFGAKRFGEKEQKNKNALIFEKTPFSYQNYLSDLSGVDTKAHENKIENIIKGIRDWLKTSSRRVTIPGHVSIIESFTNFQKQLPAILKVMRLEMESLTFNDLCLIVEEFLISTNPSKTSK